MVPQLIYLYICYQPVHSKGDQSWVFFERTKAETPILWPPHVKSWLIGKDSDAGRDWGQEEKGMTEDEMAGWHHWLDGCEVWVNSRSWWWTGRPGVLWFMGLQRVGHDWETELNWTECGHWAFWIFSNLPPNSKGLKMEFQQMLLVPDRFFSQ